LSTDFPGHDEWLSQAEAARILGITRQAINKLVGGGRVASREIGGRVFVSRIDLFRYRPTVGGRPIKGGNPRVDQLDEMSRVDLLRYLRTTLPPHPVESRLNAPAEIILDALFRSGQLTIRMLRGIVAESVFQTLVVDHLPGWRSLPVISDSSFDFQLADGVGEIRVQVKLQRSERGNPVKKGEWHVVETQRTRGGRSRADQSPTRPYRYGEFDILAVCLQPSTGRWTDFLYTVARWLQPKPTGLQCIATYQPVPLKPNDDWTNDFLTCVSWHRSSANKAIEGSLRK
jgi:hypothetical protein